MLLLRDHLKRLLNQNIQLRFNQMPPQLLPWKRHNQPLQPKRSQQPLSLNQLLLKRRKRRKLQRKKLNQSQPLPENLALKASRLPQRSLPEQPPRLELFTEEEKLELRSLRRELP